MLQMGLKEPVIQMRKFVLPPLLLQSATTSHTYKCCEIKLLRVNKPKLAKRKTHLNEIKLQKINTPYRKSKHTFAAK